MMAAGIEGEDREGQQPLSHEELGETEPQGDEDPRQQPQAPGESEVEDDDAFDFGKAKMEFFKQRARQILVDVPMGV